MIPTIPKVKEPYNQYPPKMVAFSRNQVLWRFGLQKGSALAERGKRFTKYFLYVRSLFDGRILETEFNISSYPTDLGSHEMFQLLLSHPNYEETNLTEVEQVRKELASQILVLLSYRQKLLTGQLFALLNYIV